MAIKITYKTHLQKFLNSWEHLKKKSSPLNKNLTSPSQWLVPGFLGRQVVSSSSFFASSSRPSCRSDKNHKELFNLFALFIMSNIYLSVMYRLPSSHVDFQARLYEKCEQLSSSDPLSSLSDRTPPQKHPSSPHRGLQAGSTIR